MNHFLLFASKVLLLVILEKGNVEQNLFYSCSGHHSDLDRASGVFWRDNSVELFCVTGRLARFDQLVFQWRQVVSEGSTDVHHSGRTPHISPYHQFRNSLALWQLYMFRGESRWRYQLFCISLGSR